ncbi:MAG: ribosomal-processing cysteine protease Prp [Treponema sp.]|jgi:uncharacterized protein YsxB (DUF464 family)|nr:ribosomal-processing cysteine protease Prp [Treponema sp.]
MIRASVILDKTGLLRRCEIRGHAEAGPKGGDIVCAAVSVLARTALTVLEARGDISVRGEAPERGVFFLEAEAGEGPGRDFLAAVGNFLLEGLDSIAGEYPKNCRIRTRREDD